MDTFGTTAGQTSGGYYAGIGYEQTESVHFEDLKAKQEVVKTKALEVVKEFKVLAKLEKKQRKAKVEKRKKEAEKRKNEAEKKGAETNDEEVGKKSDEEESDDDDDDDNEDEDDLELTLRCHSFCAARQEVMDLTRCWAKEGANQIAAFPGQRAKERTKRTIDFINLIKIKLRKTAPIGMEEENPDDARWLETFTTTLPEADEMAIAAGEGKGIGGRLRGAASAMFTAINSPAKAFSSIRTSTPDAGKKNEDEEEIRRKVRRRDEKGRYVKESNGDNYTPQVKEPISNLEEELGDGCPIKNRNPDHDCTIEIAAAAAAAAAAEAAASAEAQRGQEEEKEKEKEEEAEKEASMKERAADLIKSTGNLKLAKEMKEAEERLKAARQEAEDEAKRAREEEERIKKESEKKEAEEEKKREEEEEELREILKRMAQMERKEKEKREMSKRKMESLKRKREEKEKEISRKEEKKSVPTKKDRKIATSEPTEEEEGKWQEVKSKKGKMSKKRREKARSDSSSSEEPSQSESESDSSDEEQRNQKTMKEVKMEQLARSRMVEARPKNEDEKFGDNGSVTYQSFKNRFNAVAKVEGINPLDVLNEIGNWLTGTPKRMADAFKGAEDPKQAIKDIWEQLDRYYTIKSLTAHERIQPILKKGNIAKDDIDAHIELVADLANVKTEARIAKMEKQLDRVDIIRDIINGKLSYLSEEFYVEEAKEKRDDPSFRYKFQDVIDITSEKAQILKARGITSKKPSKTAGVAATQMMSNGQMGYNEVVEHSPPKPQQPASSCECCQSTQHSIQNCNKLWNMKLEDRMVELRKYHYCFRCMNKGHIAKFCKNKPVKCGKCSLFGHPNILHGIRELRQQQQQQRLATAAAAASTSNMNPPNSINNNPNTSNQQPTSTRPPISNQPTMGNTDQGEPQQR